MDIYSTQSLAYARVVLSHFEAVNSSLYGEYNAATLNASQATINEILQAGYPSTPTYLWSTLFAYNATGPLNITTAANNQSASDGSSGPSNSKTTLAM